MSWNLDSSRPIYVQLVEKIQLDIISGTYEPGARLPSVRELASQAGVNPNTMQKALSELERKKLVHSVRTSGRFITEDETMIEERKEELASAQIRTFFEKMCQMGFDADKTIRLIEKMLKEEEL
ncbi:MAG: GntR family transcriptional regulator [Eubacteriales bacterium]|nr:GntR family transcriptional regulator [Eubacteriales bacterium]